jgi:hypothetical protein
MPKRRVWSALVETNCRVTTVLRGQSRCLVRRVRYGPNVPTASMENTVLTPSRDIDFQPNGGLAA